MKVEEFFDLFLKELEGNKELWTYYKFLTDEKRFAFRKAYFCQRLQYVIDNIGDRDQAIWDCGCGYGTTALFLAMNGYPVHGTTLEFYYKQIDKRKAYWSNHGNVSLFSCAYEDLYTTEYEKKFDTILLQDTLHHLEPIDTALGLLHRSLRANGRLLIIEENGCNFIQNFKLWRQRGFNKKVETFDERLNKHVVFGDENIRCLKKWNRLLKSRGFRLVLPSLQHIRFLPPYFFNRGNYKNMIDREARLAQQSSLLAGFFYFGINFIALKTEN